MTRLQSLLGLLLLPLAAPPAPPESAAAASPQEAVALRVDEEVTADLATGDAHVYLLDLEAGWFVYGEADQRTVDVVVTALGPDGDTLATFDGPARGPEPFRFETGPAGAYRLEVRPFEEEEGRYAVRVRRAEPVASTPEGRVDQIMAAYDGNGPGGVVAVVRDGALAFARGYGLANLEYGVPNTPSTPWHMASVSKQFTAFAVLLLAEEGKLFLEDDVREHIPELHDFGETITLRHLLTHTSGLRDQWNLWVMSGGRMDDVIRQEDLFRLVTRQRALNFSPGSEYLYSNTGYMLLAEVVERVSGEPFGEFMRARVFEPLGMASTQIYDDHERLVEGRAYSYRRGGEGVRKAVLSYANSGATSLFTTAEDLARWLRNFRTAEVGGLRLLERMQEPGVLTGGDTLGYALGISVGEHRGLAYLTHGGADAGYRTSLVYHPRIDAGVVVLGNVAGFDAGGIAAEVAETFFADEMTDEEVEEEETPEEPEEEEPPPDLTPQALEAFAGRYHSPELETAYTLGVEDGRLVARHVRHGEIGLTASGEDAFTGEAWFFRDVTFRRDEDGIVEAMLVSNGRVRDLVFVRQEP